MSALPSAVLAGGACLSWLVVARRRTGLARRAGLFVAVWAALRCAGHLWPLLGVPGPLAPLACFAVAALAPVAAAALALRALVRFGVLTRALGEAAVVSTAAVSVVWVVTGPSTAMHAWLATRLMLTVLDVVIVAIVVRLPVMAPALISDRQYRIDLALGSVAAAGVGLADGLLALASADGPRLPVLVTLSQAVGYLAAVVLPWVLAPAWPDREAGSGPVAPAAVRWMPYLLVAVTVLAASVRSLTRGLDATSVMLVALVVFTLVATQAAALRDIAYLVADLSSSRARLAALLENTGDVIVRLDAAGRVVTANAATRALLAVEPEAVAGQALADLAGARDRQAVAAVVREVVEGRAPAAQVELALAPPAGGTAELRLRGIPDGAVGNLHDVTDAVRLRARLEQLARYDQMTGLANRTHLLERINAWLAEDTGSVPAKSAVPGAQAVRRVPGRTTGRRPETSRRVSVLFGDLDGFKGVNDRFGHVAGDVVLVAVAHRLEAAIGDLRVEHLLARIGGDEFVLALRGVEDAELRVVAEHLIEAIRPAFPVGDRTVTLAMSLGTASVTWDAVRPSGTGGVGGPRQVSEASQAGEAGQAGEAEAPAAVGPAGEAGAVDAATLLHRADLAMFAAKAQGPGRVESWREDLEERAARRVDIAIGLRAALDTGRLALAYQPLFRLSDGVVIGAEALIRVPSDDTVPGSLGGLSGIVTPAEIIAVAEDTGTIIEMGEWVLTQATRQAATWAADGHELLIAVNLSPGQLAAPGFADSVLRILAAAGLPARRLLLEITESQLVDETGPVLGTLERLRACGVALAIDDFGTGYSSLAYLRRLPVQLVKLDRSLLDGVADDPRARHLVRAVIAMARALGLLVVAEGLEDLPTVRAVHGLGAYAGQGFALSEPVPPAELAAILARGPLDLRGGPAPSGPAERPHLVDLRSRMPRRLPAPIDTDGGDERR